MEISNRIPHIQGLRGFSIILILLYHAGYIFPGGFIGVDVFFVISGFVITKMLMRECESNERGTIAWGKFFFNRARRLLPSLTVVATISFLIAITLFSEVDRFAISKEVFPAVFFYSNAFYFLRNDYHSLDSQIFTHTWSLSVEEQFYLILPTLFLLGWIIKKSFKTTRRLALLIVFSIFLIISLSLSIVLSNYSKLFGIPIHLLPERFGFFATPARIWEILLGSIGALMPGCAVSRRLRNLLSGICILILLASAFLFDPWITFPGLNAVPIVLATLFITMFGDQLLLISKLLSSRLLVWLGEMSYNIYLVHWPILVIAQNQLGSQGYVRLSAIALSLPLASFLHKKVDQPIRKLSEINRFRALTTIGLLVALPALSVVGFRQAVSTVDLTTINFKSEKPYYSLGSNICVDIKIQDFDRSKCISGDLKAKKKLMLVGDSHSASISEAVISAYLELNPNGSVFVWSMSGCPFLIDNNPNLICDTNRDFLMELVDKEKPNEIIIANAITRYLGVTDTNYLPFGLKRRLNEVKLSYQRTLSFLDQSQIPIYFFHEIPKLDSMLKENSVALGKVQKRLNELLESAVPNSANVRFIDPSQVICPNKMCSRIVNKKAIYLDGDPEHLTGSGSMQLKSLFTRVFTN
jgi:peptidoglycan/LPS O-acetylase OafA/YrhL